MKKFLKEKELAKKSMRKSNYTRMLKLDIESPKLISIPVIKQTPKYNPGEQQTPRTMAKSCLIGQNKTNKMHSHSPRVINFVSRNRRDTDEHLKNSIIVDPSSLQLSDANDTDISRYSSLFKSTSITNDGQEKLKKSDFQSNRRIKPISNLKYLKSRSKSRDSDAANNMTDKNESRKGSLNEKLELKKSRIRVKSGIKMLSDSIFETAMLIKAKKKRETLSNRDKQFKLENKPILNNL